LAYHDNGLIKFIETPVFTQIIVEMMTDAEYAELQAALVFQPDLGYLIPGTGGIRKVRWSEPKRGRGKRGGVRVIYYWHVAGSLIYLLLAYSKTDRDDLSVEQKRKLRKLISEFK
jgi:mRNA-degrading endonuclease RelE of RelBE toxin-antitoxin system